MMKALMTGNEAIARGAYEAGCLVASAYPGTPSTEILENLATYDAIYSEWSPNEKVALEVASGASIAGVRAICSMKHVGLNVAADPLFTMSYVGALGGLVIVTADDPGFHSSQNEQDNRNYAWHAKTILIEPSDSQECKDFVKAAFALSEEFDMPVIFRSTTRISHSKSIVTLQEREEPQVKTYRKNISKNLMLPLFAAPKHTQLEQRLQELKKYGCSCKLNKVEYANLEIGVITSGISYQYAKEVFGDNASYLKLGLTNPLPEELIREFSAKVGRVIVVEENDPFLENQIKAMGIACTGKNCIPACGELNVNILKKALLQEDSPANYTLDVAVPKRPAALCPGCPHRGMFYEVSKYKEKIVAAGDIGCYSLGALPPLSVADFGACMGASLSAGAGFKRACMQENRDVKVFGFLGDSTFFHSGITGLIDTVYNNTPLVTVILDNRTTAMTGQQQHPGTGFTAMGKPTQPIDIATLVKAIGIKEENLRTVDPYDLAATEKAVADGYAATEPFVIITKRSCALLPEVRKERAGLFCQIEQDACKKCKKCLALGCQAISLKENRLAIDQNMCNGCGMCKQVCPFGAIVSGNEE